MQPINTDQAHFLLHTLYLPALKGERRITTAVIQAIPPDQADYRPDAISKSAIDLAWHIAATEMRFMDAVMTGAFNLSPQPRPESVKTPADLIEWYNAEFDPRFEKLTRLTPEQSVKIVDFRGIFQLPAVAYLTFVMSHSIHHRGQLSMYLRPMGAKVPSIYGESYDAAEARKSAQQGA
jgi:uncharacterized damage-inducible protein DinB